MNTSRVACNRCVVSAVTRLIALSVLRHSLLPSVLLCVLPSFLVTPALPARHVPSPLNFLTLFAVAFGRGALPLALGLTDALEMTRYVRSRGLLKGAVPWFKEFTYP